MPDNNHQESPFHDVLQNCTDGASALFYRFVDLARNQTKEVVQAGLEACQRTFPLMTVWQQALAEYNRGERTMGDIAVQFRRQTQDTVKLGAAVLAEFRVILTLSNSSVVHKAITSTASSPRVLCAESLPGGEGALQAKALHEAGIQATMVKDVDIHETMQQVQAIALGADQWNLNRFINKVGSEKLVKQAEVDGIPVFVLAERFKQEARISEGSSTNSPLERSISDDTAVDPLFESVVWRPHTRLITNTEFRSPAAP